MFALLPPPRCPALHHPPHAQWAAKHCPRPHCTATSSQACFLPFASPSPTLVPSLSLWNRRQKTHDRKALNFRIWRKSELVPASARHWELWTKQFQVSVTLPVCHTVRRTSAQAPSIETGRMKMLTQGQCDLRSSSSLSRHRTRHRPSLRESRFCRQSYSTGRAHRGGRQLPHSRGAFGQIPRRG